MHCSQSIRPARATPNRNTPRQRGVLTLPGNSKLGIIGFEPRLTDPESVVLPLHQSPVIARIHRFHRNYIVGSRTVTRRPYVGYVSNSLMTCCSSTPVRRWSRPWNLNVNFAWSMPRQCRIVALRSFTWAGFSATL